MSINNNYGISILIYTDLRIKDILIVAKQQDDQVVVKLQFSDEDWMKYYLRYKLFRDIKFHSNEVNYKYQLNKLKNRFSNTFLILLHVLLNLKYM